MVSLVSIECLKSGNYLMVSEGYLQLFTLSYGCIRVMEGLDQVATHTIMLPTINFIIALAMDVWYCSWFSRARWWSMIATLVARCQQTWTLELLRWPAGLLSPAVLPAQLSLLSSPSSEPDIDFKLRYLLVGDSSPRSRAYCTQQD